jgi:hypothetical protein
MPPVSSGLFLRETKLLDQHVAGPTVFGARIQGVLLPREWALAAQLKVEDAAVERQRFLDVADFQHYVVEADGARLCGANHSTLLSVDNVHKLDHNIVR